MAKIILHDFPLFSYLNFYNANSKLIEITSSVLFLKNLHLFVESFNHLFLNSEIYLNYFF